MRYWAAVFFLISLVAAVLGFSGIAGDATGLAKVLFLVFLALGIGAVRYGKPRPLA